MSGATAWRRRAAAGGRPDRLGGSFQLGPKQAGRDRRLLAGPAPRASRTTDRSWARLREAEELSPKTRSIDFPMVTAGSEPGESNTSSRHGGRTKDVRDRRLGWPSPVGISVNVTTSSNRDGRDPPPALRQNRFRLRAVSLVDRGNTSIEEASVRHNLTREPVDSVTRCLDLEAIIVTDDSDVRTLVRPRHPNLVESSARARNPSQGIELLAARYGQWLHSRGSSLCQNRGRRSSRRRRYASRGDR